MLFSIARLVLKGNNTEMSADVLGFTMESNGIRILEPFDTSLKYSNASGKTNIHISISDIFMNFTFSILRLFLAVEDDILSFLRMTSKKMTIVCSHFDKVGIIKSILIFSILFLFWVNMLATVFDTSHISCTMQILILIKLLLFGDLTLLLVLLYLVTT